MERVLICPYNNFRKCDWENCAARMWVEDKQCGGRYLMRVCAIAYNGGTVPPKSEAGGDLNGQSGSD